MGTENFPINVKSPHCWRPFTDRGHPDPNLICIYDRLNLKNVKKLFRTHIAHILPAKSFVAHEVHFREQQSSYQ
jgi:hypothetical protein